jgi:hypothetical protein
MLLRRKVQLTTKKYTKGKINNNVFIAAEEEQRVQRKEWIPASAGMTNGVRINKGLLSQLRSG